MTSYHHGVRVIQKDGGTRSIGTVNTSVIGVVGTAPDADTTAFPLNEPVLISGSRTTAALLDTTGKGQGTLPGVMNAIFAQIEPMIVVVRVEENDTEATQLSNIIGTVDSAGQYTGLQALLAAQTKLGVKPRILGAPGFSHHQAIAAELVTIADSLRAFAYVDSNAATAEAAVTYRKLFGSERLMVIWPGLISWDEPSEGYVNEPASARALGLRAKIDNFTGWHKTISNVVINGATGLTADVDFNLQNPNSKSNYLNENEITTVIMQDGYRFWGSRTCSADPKFAFESAARTNDILSDIIADAHAWAVDMPMSQVLIDNIIEGVNAKFRRLKAQGYIVNAECYLDPELNTTDSLEAGKLWLNYDFTPVPPLEGLGFYAEITSQYLGELLTTAQAA